MEEALWLVFCPVVPCGELLAVSVVEPVEFVVLVAVLVAVVDEVVVAACGEPACPELACGEPVEPVEVVESAEVGVEVEVSEGGGSGSCGVAKVVKVSSAVIAALPEESMTMTR